MIPVDLPNLKSMSTSVALTHNITPEYGNKNSLVERNNGAAAAATMLPVVCGGLSGMLAKTVTNPFERIKVLSQTGDHLMKSSSIIDLYTGIIRNEGVIGLWAGNGANLVRIFPAKGILFSTNDVYQEFFRKVAKTSKSEKLPLFYTFISGGVAGMTACALTYPLDFAQGRISGKLASYGNRKEYRGIIRTVLTTVKDEGVLALYKGVTPTIMGALPYEGIKFGTVGFLEQCFPVEQTTPLRKMMFGGIGGVIAGLVTFPNDTVRRLLQLQGSRGSKTNYCGFLDCIRQTYKSEGITRFYRGFTINIVRMVPNAAVQFGSYEVLKNLTKNYF